MISADQYKVYVVIVVYNGMQWLQRCLSSVTGSVIPLKIILIDNGSVDGSQEFIKAEFPEINFIQAETNLGFGKANNIGIKQAFDEGAAYVFLLNQDAWVETDTIGNLVKISETEPQFAVLSPMHLNEGYSALDYNFSNYIAPKLCPDLYSDIYTNNLKTIYSLPFINAAAWLLSVKCVSKVGLFDSLFFHYGEDRNYCQRVLYHGFKIGICPSERIVHDRGGRKGVSKGFDGRAGRQRMILIELSDVSQNSLSGFYYKLIIKAIAGIIKNCVLINIKGIKDSFSDCLFLIKNIKLARQSVDRNRKDFNIINAEVSGN